MKKQQQKSYLLSCKERNISQSIFISFFTKYFRESTLNKKYLRTYIHTTYIHKIKAIETIQAAKSQQFLNSAELSF